MSSESSSDAEITDEESSQKASIREELSSMTFEEILKLKDELGTKVYKEALLGAEEKIPRSSKANSEFKRLNKNRPREMSAKRQVPFLGIEKQLKHTKEEIPNARDPRFDEKSGEYNIKKFKENFKFVMKIRKKEIEKLKEKLKDINDETQRKELKHTMQKLINKNVEESRWHKQQSLLRKEQAEIQKARSEGKQPHYVTKRERRAKELVEKFEELQKTGRLSKHLEKRRKKNVAKDRKKFSFD